MITQQQFSEFIERRYGFSWQTLTSDRRFAPLPFLRMLIGIYYCRYLTTAQVGDILNRDHATVVGYRQHLDELLPQLTDSERDIMDSFNCFVAAWDPEYTKVLPVPADAADSLAGVMTQGVLNVVLTAHENSNNTMVVMSRWRQVKAEDLTQEQLTRVLALVHVAHSHLLSLAKEKEWQP